MQAITPFLWFNNNAEEAANFYVSVFRNASITSVQRYAEGAPVAAGTVMTVSFALEGITFVALNGGPHFSFTPAVSFVIDCADQEEVDYYWDRLTDGGEESMCGWLKDRFGLSWQVVPRQLPQLLNHPDPAKAQYAMQAMLGMKKIIIEELRMV